MKIATFITRIASFQMITGVVLLTILSASASVGNESISPDAERILRSMSTYMAGMKTFSMNADVDFEFMSTEGQKLQLSSFVTAVIKRPSSFFISRKGMVADTEYVYDGKTLTLYGKNLNVYSQTALSGTIDDALLDFELTTGLPAPGADLLFSDPFTMLVSGVRSGEYLGTAYVNGVKCHHLAFRKEQVDWQLWVKEGEEPFPMKYVITTKWITGAPQYELRLRDWRIDPQITSDQFSFSIPDGAKKIEQITAEEMGEITSVMEEEK
jgi:hypothetical protein